MRFSNRPTYNIALGGLFIALFFFASNLIPPVCFVPNVPVTLQILVVALMGGLLGVRAGLFSLLALYIFTVAGLPLMSSFHAGPAAFLTPTGGFIFGWVFVVLFAGLCRALFAVKFAGKRGSAAYSALMFAFCAVGVLMDYAAGAAWLSVYSGSGLRAFSAAFTGLMIFLPFDAVKCAIAAGLCATFACSPGLMKLSRIR